MGELKNANKTLVENIMGRDHLNDGRIILKWSFEKCGVVMWAKLIWLRAVPSDGLLRTQQWILGVHGTRESS